MALIFKTPKLLRAKYRTREFQVYGVLFTLALSASIIAVAHTPHDTIDALTISNSDKNNAIMFMVRAGRHVMRSHDGGASWKELVNGIDARYDITSLALVPDGEQTKTLYMATDGDGVYVSSDSGSSWKKSNTGLGSLRIQQLGAAATDDKSVLIFAAARNGGLFRRLSDEGDWQRVLDQQVKVTAVAFQQYKDELRVLIGDDKGNVQVSADNGSSWDTLASVKGAGAINSIALSETARDKPVIFLGTERRAVLRSLDGGSSFADVSNWNFDKQVISVRVSPEFEHDATLYASTWHEAVLQSKDGGSTWQKYNTGLSTDAQADLPAFYSPYFRQIAIDEARGETYLAGFDGLFKSKDKGHNWQQVETEPVGNIWALSLSPDLNDDFIVAVTTFDAGVYMTNNSDLNWSIHNRGLRSTRLRKLVFSPSFAEDHTVFSSEDEGDNLLRSIDGGQSWSAINLCPGWYVYLKRKILGALRYRGAPAWLTTDLLTKAEKLRANPKVLVLSQGFATDHYLYIGTRYRGNFESTDAGQSLSYAEKSPFPIWNLTMSPNFATDKTLFASSRESGVYKSINAGATWRAVNSGLDFLKVWQTRVSADNARMNAELGRSQYYDILLAVSPDYGNDKTLFAAGGAGVFKSTNGGESWKQKGQSSLPGHYVFAVAVSPNYELDQTLVVSIKGKGLFDSTDGGETFSDLGARLIADNHEMRHIAFSPSYASDKSIYAVSLEDIFRSTDAGANWQLLERPIRYESHKFDVITYKGDWAKVQNGNFSARWAHQSRSEDSSVSFSFVGTGVKWIGVRSPELGQAEVYLDGKRAAIVDQHSEAIASSTAVYSIQGLPYRQHNLTLKTATRDDVRATGSGILIDAFDVTGNRRENR